MILWAILLLVVTSVAVYVATVVLPRLYLKLSYAVKTSCDRCIKRVYEKRGQSMVFQPEEKWRKYIDQYVLSERNGKKELMCKVDPELEYIEFDVVVFNNRDKVECVIKTKELLEQNGYTKIVELPEETSYVSINILKVENQAFEDHISGKVKKENFGKFLLGSSVVIIMEAIFAKICLANIFGGVLREAFVVNFMSLLLSLAIVVAMILINVLLSSIAIKMREKKFTVKVKKNA